MMVKLNNLVEYEKCGTNGIIESQPKIIKFKGFELNKKHRLKLLITNKSKFTQRLNIIPPTTCFFKIQFTKKGLIAAGLSEIVYVNFYPQNYQ